jgi:hypothetical protein
MVEIDKLENWELPLTAASCAVHYIVMTKREFSRKYVLSGYFYLAILDAFLLL